MNEKFYVMNEQKQYAASFVKESVLIKEGWEEWKSLWEQTKDKPKNIKALSDEVEKIISVIDALPQEKLSLNYESINESWSPWIEGQKLSDEDTTRLLARIKSWNNMNYMERQNQKNQMVTEDLKLSPCSLQEMRLFLDKIKHYGYHAYLVNLRKTQVECVMVYTPAGFDDKEVVFNGYGSNDKVYQNITSIQEAFQTAGEMGDMLKTIRKISRTMKWNDPTVEHSAKWARFKKIAETVKVEQRGMIEQYMPESIFVLWLPKQNKYLGMNGYPAPLSSAINFASAKAAFTKGRRHGYHDGLAVEVELNFKQIVQPDPKNHIDASGLNALITQQELRVLEDALKKSQEEPLEVQIEKLKKQLNQGNENKEKIEEVKEEKKVKRL